MGSVLVAETEDHFQQRLRHWLIWSGTFQILLQLEFNIASMTKAIHRCFHYCFLRNRGKLKTDDLVKKYLPDAPASWDKITIYHLLTHTSGIPPKTPPSRTRHPPPDKLVFNDRPRLSARRNNGLTPMWDNIVLGYLLRKDQRDRTYEEFVQENIFKPLGMNDSGLMSFW